MARLAKQNELKLMDEKKREEAKKQREENSKKAKSSDNNKKVKTAEPRKNKNTKCCNFNHNPKKLYSKGEEWKYCEVCSYFFCDSCVTDQTFATHMQNNHAEK